MSAKQPLPTAIEQLCDTLNTYYATLGISGYKAAFEEIPSSQFEGSSHRYSIGRVPRQAQGKILGLADKNKIDVHTPQFGRGERIYFSFLAKGLTAEKIVGLEADIKQEIAQLRENGRVPFPDTPVAKFGFLGA